MLYLILALVALGLISAIFGIVSHRRGEDEEPLQEGVSCNTCNGENSKCEQECMMEAATKEIEYYDDEDLDRFAGRDADASERGMGDAAADEYQSAGNDVGSDKAAQDACQKGAYQCILEKCIL